MVMTVRELVKQYRAHQPDGVFFNRDTLSFYGERIEDMRITGKGTITDRDGDNYICWELRTLQRHPRLGRRFKLYYFDTDTNDIVMPDREDTTTAWMRERT